MALLSWISDTIGYRCPECALYVAIARQERAECPDCPCAPTPAGDARDDAAEPVYRIVVEIPARAGAATAEKIIDAVSDAADAAQPVERDWDVFIFGRSPARP